MSGAELTSLQDREYLDGESWWRDHYTWLDEAGYTLRPRYHPDWKPSWIGAGKGALDCEDGLFLIVSHINDAVRKSDGAFVTLKQIKTSRHPYEVSIGQYLSSEPLASDPRNHSCPVYEVLQVPDDDDLTLLVMPLLREYTDPRFTSVGEVMECYRQIIEGLQFMHSHHIAHRDIMESNILMDAEPMFPAPYHPLSLFSNRAYTADVRYYTRTERPPRYYITDFGISRRYSPDEANPLEEPILGGDKTVPEFQEDPEVPRNPFHTDIYYLGNTIREEVFKVYTNFGFLEPLVKEMVVDDPAARPTMDEVAERFDKILQSLSSWKLRSRPVMRRDSGSMNFVKDVWHIYKTATYVLRRFKPMPGLSS